MENALIIPSGGVGSRFGSEIPKQYVLLEGIPIIIRTILRFQDLNFINYVFIAIESHWEEFVSEHLANYNFSKKVIFVKSGKTRAESIKNCVLECEMYDIDFLFVHDAVRCNVSKKLVQNMYDNVGSYSILIPGLASSNTMKIVKKNKVVNTLNRDEVYSIQTPQLIKRSLYKKFIKKVDILDPKYSDDSSIFEEYLSDIKVIEGDPYNIKITNKFDFEFSKYILLNNLLD